MPGVLSRIGAVDRIGLSPEGNTNAELRRLTLSLLADGFRVFVFYFHSPSVQPGCTPYVRDERDLKSFLANCRDYLAFFRNELQGQGADAARDQEVARHIRRSKLPQFPCPTIRISSAFVTFRPSAG